MTQRNRQQRIWRMRHSHSCAADVRDQFTIARLPLKALRSALPVCRGEEDAYADPCFLTCVCTMHAGHGAEQNILPDDATALRA